MFDTFSVLFEDENYIAINKPSGIMVHRTSISEDQQFVLQILRRQVGYRIYPIHRLDRGTSGVLVFGKTSIAANQLAEQFREQKVEKQYLGVVRGYLEREGTVNYALAREPGKEKRQAITHYRVLQETEISVPIGRYQTARYSLVEMHPKTGRRHQIRRHFSHLRHPIINDKKHGDVKHNKYWANELGIRRMLLHAQRLRFTDPKTNQVMEVTASLEPDFRRALTFLFGEGSLDAHFC